MSRRIDLYVPPMEPCVIWSGGFTDEECDSIKDTGELCEFLDAKVGSSGEDGTLDETARKTKIVWIQPKEETAWIFERMNEIVAKMNFDKFQMDLTQFDGFQYSKYEVGDHYDWHNDTVLSPRSGLFRKLSFSLMLSDVDDYEGGEFLLSTSGSETKTEPMKVKKGDLVAFYSHIPHKVSPVTSGQRLTLVTWALGSKFK
jgi:PKHD-type hydroxylase